MLFQSEIGWRYYYITELAGQVFLKFLFRFDWPLFRPAAGLIRHGGTPSALCNMLSD
jgi:hypothetical protein